MSKILIVDDEISIRRGLKKVLNAEGYEVEEAQNGNQALKKLKEDKFDLVIIDIFMPEKDGIETILELKKMNEEIKIIAMTGYKKSPYDNDSPDFLKYSRQFGAFEVLQKPFKIEELLKAIKNLIP